MRQCGVIALNLFLCLLLTGGCSSSAVSGKPVRKGPKVNVSHFFLHPAAYKGKTITLPLVIAEAIDRSRGQSLRQYANRYVQFAANGSGGEKFSLVIRLPENVSIPEAARGDEVEVTFVCSRGDLRQGNEATALVRRLTTS
jgi:hypothetical protein